jgi:penicillin-insensitive murein endopeptidase
MDTAGHPALLRYSHRWRPARWLVVPRSVLRHGLSILLLVLTLVATPACRRDVPAASLAQPPVDAATTKPDVGRAEIVSAVVGQPARTRPQPSSLDEIGLAELPTPSGDPTPEDWIGKFGALPAGRQSRSIGTAQNGWLQGGIPIQSTDVIRVVPQTIRRGIFFGTGELVGLLGRSAAAVAGKYPKSVLRVANLSRAGGGDIGPSVSHNSGRDADVLFYAYERRHQDTEPDNFTHYDELGIADAPASAAGRYEFDTERNWALVRHWLSDPEVVVQWIFVSIPLRNRLLDYALRTGEPETLRRRAARVLVQPRDSSPHADHFHLRIACPPADRPACIDGYRVPDLARAAQVDALMEMYHHGTPAEQRYARELLSLPPDGVEVELPPIEGPDTENAP